MALTSRTKSRLFNLLKKLPLRPLFSPFYAGEGSILFMHKFVEAHDLGKNRIEMMQANELSISYLETIIRQLSRTHDFISPDDIATRLNHAKSFRRPFIVITMDDGYKDNLTLAYPIFKKYKVPFTVYITNCFPDYSFSLWWYHLEDLLLDNITLEIPELNKTFSLENPDEKNRAFVEIRDRILSMAPGEQQQIVNSLLERHGINPLDRMKKEAMSWEEIKILAKDPLVTIGAHTMNHLALSKIETDDLEYEIEQSRIELEQKLGIEIRHFAFPYGTQNEVGSREIDFLKLNTPFSTAVTTSTGTIFKSHAGRMHQLPRIQVLGNQEDFSILEMYLCGMLPALKNRLKRVV